MGTLVTMSRWFLLALTAAACFAQDIDPSVGACANFYQHACGVWRQQNPVPSDQARWARFDELQERNNGVLRKILESASADRPERTAVEKRVGDYYAACMDEAGIEGRGTTPLKANLERIAALPNKQAITDELVRLNRMGVRPFFFFDSELDAKDATKMIAGIDQGGLTLPDRDYYLKTDAESVQLQKKYVAHLTKMFELLGDAPAAAGAKAATIMRIETNLAKGSLDLVSRRDPNKVFHRYKTAELISLSPGIDWAKFFTGMGVAGLDSLNVAVPAFIRQIEDTMVRNSLADLKTYLTWRLLHDSAPMLPAAFVNENFAFFGKTLSGSKELRARWKRCVSHVDAQLGDAVGEKYVDLTFGAEGKERTLKMVKAIEQAMERDIKSLEWMSGSTKDQALTKLHTIVNKIGYPDKWKDYSAATIERGDALANYFRLSEWEVNHEIAKIGKPVDKNQWMMSPPTVNAYYNPQMNDINFPAGILQRPFYSNDADEATNFGAIGAVIGHELTHGFDDQGRQFDAAGNLRDWWTAEDGKKFEQRADCLVKEYGGFTAIGDVKLNGQLTLGENTADNGGVRIALMALMATPQKTVNGLTAEQRFFYGYARIWCENSTPESKRLRAQTDPHAPAEFRVNGVLANMPEFQKAFACKTGDAMVSGNACRVW